MDEQEVVQEDSDDWEDDSKAKEKKPKKKVDVEMEDYGEEAQDQVEDLTKPEVWNEQKDPLKEDEELEFENEAYQMLHRSLVEWPCLSIDVLIKERLTFPNT